MALIYLLAAIAIFYAVKAWLGSMSSAASGITDTSGLFEWPPLMEFDFEVVGESFYQPALKALAGDHGDDSSNLLVKAVLVPDSKNPHDDKAVRVEVEGLKVGHLSRADARSFRRRLGAKKLGQQPTCCQAMITGGHRLKDGGRAHYGLMLDIKPFD